MVAWILICTGMTIWFVTGLYIMTWDSSSKKAEKLKDWKHPISNRKYKRFLKSAGWKAINKIIVECDYNEWPKTEAINFDSFGFYLNSFLNHFVVNNKMVWKNCKNKWIMLK